MSAEESTDDAPPKFMPTPGGADPLATWLQRELPHDRGLLAARYDASGRYLVAGALDRFVHRWDLADTSETGQRDTFSGHQSWVRAMDWCPGREQLVTGDYVGQLMLWPALEETPKATFSIADAHEGSIRAVSVSPDGKTIASAGNDGLVKLWSATDGKAIQELRGHDCHVYNVAFHPEGDGLVSADLEGKVIHWNVADATAIRELDASPLHTYSEKYSVDVGGVRGMSFDAVGSRLACAGGAGEKGIAHSGSARILIFDWKSGELVQELNPGHEEICTAWSVRFHPDGFVVASGGSRTGGYLWFWHDDPSKNTGGAPFHQVKFKQRAPGFDVDLSPDGKTLAVANYDGSIRLWQMSPEPEKEETQKKA